MNAKRSGFDVVVIGGGLAGLCSAIHLSKFIFLNQKITSLFSDNTYILKDSFGIPNLCQKEKKLPISISKSYHGNYYGFAILNKYEYQKRTL